MKELIGQIIREVADFLDKSQVQRLEIILKEKLSRCNDRKSVFSLSAGVACR